jgi:hypothetical protein
MRKLVTGSVLKVKAIAGFHVVALAWDFSKKLTVGGGVLPPELDDLLGFSVARAEKDAHGPSSG